MNIKGAAIAILKIFTGMIIGPLIVFVSTRFLPPILFLPLIGMTIIGSIIFGFMNKKYRMMARGVIISTFVLPAILFVWMFGSMMGFVTKNYHKPEDCPEGHLSSVTSCKGFERSGWQNSGNYYFIAKGTPRTEVASDFLNNLDKIDSPVIQSCDGEEKEQGWQARACKEWEWRNTDCSKYGLSDWTCYENDRMASNGNTHYYFLVAFSNDHQKGVYFSGSKHSPGEFVDDISWEQK